MITGRLEVIKLQAVTASRTVRHWVQRFNHVTLA